MTATRRRHGAKIGDLPSCPDKPSGVAANDGTDRKPWTGGKAKRKMGQPAGGPVRRHRQARTAQRLSLTRPNTGPHRWPAGLLLDPARGTPGEQRQEQPGDDRGSQAAHELLHRPDNPAGVEDKSSLESPVYSTNSFTCRTRRQGSFPHDSVSAGAAAAQWPRSRTPITSSREHAREALIPLEVRRCNWPGRGCPRSRL
jgi:hypothetical protein